MWKFNEWNSYNKKKKKKKLPNLVLLAEKIMQSQKLMGEAKN